MFNLDKLSQTHRKFTNGKEIHPIRVTEYDGKFYLRLDRNKNISRANGIFTIDLLYKLSIWVIFNQN